MASFTPHIKFFHISIRQDIIHNLKLITAKGDLRLTKGFKIFESKVTTAISHTISKAVKSDSELQTKFKDFLLEILGGEKSL